MDTEFVCLSLPELLDIRNGVPDDAASEHLANCLRCRAMLATIPNDFVTLAPTGDLHVTTPAAARSDTGADSPITGAVWRALGAPGDDFAWLVAVIGRAPDAEDRVVVAPVFGPPAVPTDHDLLLDAKVLGYFAFADVANTGTILISQLVEPLGQLSERAVELLSALYRAVLSDEPMPPAETLGVPVISSADPRLLAANERSDALRRLWRAADRLVDLEKNGDEDEAVASELTLELSLPVLLAGYLEGPDAEWDRSSLLERSHADGTAFDAFCDNKLDLTDHTDVADLAKVLHVLEIAWEEAEPAVVRTLWASPGGARHATRSADLPLAARGASGASDQDISAAIKARHSRVDDTDAGRRQQVASYIAELRRLLDELD